MYKYLLAVRYLLKRPISWIAAVAVALCVFIVLVVMTVMNGLVGDFREKNHGYVGDCVVTSDSLVGFPYYADFMERLRGLDEVAAVSAAIRSFGLMVQGGYDRSIGVEVMGIDPAAYAEVTNFEETVYYHREDISRVFVPEYDPELTGVVVGIDMMPQQRSSQGTYYHPPTPGRYELIISCFPLTAKGALAKAGTDIVNTKSFYFSDDSETGLVKVDAQMVYIPFDIAQTMCGMDAGEPRANIIQIKFRPGVNLHEGTRRVRSLWEAFAAEQTDERYTGLLENVYVQTWVDFRRSTLAPMEKEQLMLSLLFLMLGLITVFVVFVVFYMIVSSKSKDIGILRSVGVSAAGVAQIFLMFAGLIGLLGAGAGSLLGAAFLWRINELEQWLFEKYGWQLWDRAIYAIGEIPSRIHFPVVAVIVGAALAACILGALLPSMRVARLQAAEALAVNQL